MKLSDLEKYNLITIQCHDNPDADAIGAGFGLYCYFKDCGKDVRLVYSGRNMIKKTNLTMMIDALDIPIEYISMKEKEQISGLLVTVDCQYGAGNVTRLEAENVAVIDHHPLEISMTDMVRIQPHLGSCTTLVWNMLQEMGYSVNEKENLGTALYYGLYTDTNQFAELFNPLDMDMRESVIVDKRLMNRFRNSNISLEELEVAGIAMIRYNYNDDYRFAVIKSKPCDPNILGLISDFLLQVAEIDTCAVYNEGDDGYKFSVRSCIKEVNANELAAFLADDIGSGGGHFEKAGGFISKNLYEKKYPTLHSEGYFNNRMTEYFDTFQIIYAKDMEIELSDFSVYQRRQEPICFLKASDFVEAGSRLSLRNQWGDMSVDIGEAVRAERDGKEEIYIIIDRDGTLHTMNGWRFEKYMRPTGQSMQENYFENVEYMPTIKTWTDGRAYSLQDYARMALPKENIRIYMCELDKYVKLFPKWDDDKYILGMPGDYLAVSEDDLHNIFIEQGRDFHRKFEKIEK